MEKVYDILVVGELNPDLILYGDVVPAFNQVEKMVDSASLVVGSSAAIFALGTAKLGLKIAFVGKIGDDIFGDFMVSQLMAHNIETGAIIRDHRMKTGVSIILNRGIDRACLTFPGTIPELNYPEIPLELIKKSRHLHLASYFIQSNLRPDVPSLFRRAHQFGMTTSLDTNFDPAETWDGNLHEVLDNCDIFMPNAVEAMAISGCFDIRSALTKLTQQVKIVAIKTGADGAVAASDNRVVSASSLKNISVVDTVGAGDTFDAGFIYGCLSGWDLAQSLRMGCICGSLSVRGTGGTATQPTLIEAQKFLNESDVK